MTDGPVAVTLDPTSQPITYSEARLEDLGRTHFIGIGGAGMSVLAEIMAEEGMEVSGSDSSLEGNPHIDRLRKLGVDIADEQGGPESDRLVRAAKTVVWSSAIKPDNPEIQTAVRYRKYLLHRSDILALLLSDKRAVTVAGAHGKTTTAAMIAQILETSGLGNLVDPTYAIGGSVRTRRGIIDGGHAGLGDVMVAEADESDGSFRKYHPYLAVITNVEADHLDHYKTRDAFYQAFVDYAHHAYGHVVACADDPGALQVLRSLDAKAARRAVAYTTQDPEALGDMGGISVVQIADEKVSSDPAQEMPEHFSLRFPSSLVPNYETNGAGTFTIPVELRVPGVHNARDAAAAITACLLLGMRPADAVRGIKEFYGAARRFERKGTVGGVTLIDDYGHHPTEIGALLDAVRRRYPHSRIHVIFQPHLFSRTQDFAPDFARALRKADDAIVTDIYPARQKQEDYPNVTLDTILTAARDAGIGGDWLQGVHDMHEAARIMAARAASGDIICTVGAGDITTVDDEILSALHERFDAHPEAA